MESLYFNHPFMTLDHTTRHIQLTKKNLVVIPQIPLVYGRAMGLITQSGVLF